MRELCVGACRRPFVSCVLVAFLSASAPRPEPRSIQYTQTSCLSSTTSLPLLLFVGHFRLRSAGEVASAQACPRAGQTPQQPRFTSDWLGLAPGLTRQPPRNTLPQPSGRGSRVAGGTRVAPAQWTCRVPPMSPVPRSWTIVPDPVTPTVTTLPFSHFLCSLLSPPSDPALLSMRLGAGTLHSPWSPDERSPSWGTWPSPHGVLPDLQALAMLRRV